MMHILNELISAVFQVLAFTLIPFLFFLFREEKSVTFFNYIGLYKPTGRSIIYVMIASMLLVIVGTGLVFMNDGIRQAVLSPESVTGRLRQMGFNTTSLLTLLILALIKTSLSEEILFRGFISKQLIRKLGFKLGNLSQAIIFGLVHLLLFWLLTKTTFLPLIFILIFSSFAGWTIGFIKEKYANGSIIPGWVAHGVGNTMSYFVLAFVI